MERGELRVSTEMRSQAAIYRTFFSFPFELVFRLLPFGGGAELAGEVGGVGDRDGVGLGWSSSLPLSSPAGSKRSEFSRSCKCCTVCVKSTCQIT